MTQLTVIVGYLLLLIALGFLANRLFRGTSQDYMLASHTIGPVLLLMSLFGTTMTAFALVGSTGRSYTLGVGVYGLLASCSGIVHSLCFLVIGTRLWALGRRNGYTTQIQFFRDRLDNDHVGLLLFPILVALVVSYLLLGVVGAGDVVSSVTAGAFESHGLFADSDFGVPPWLASAAVCAVVLIYVFFGGMRGTAWANAFQTSVFMVLGVMTFVTIANALGGTDSFWENMRTASEAVSEANRSRAQIPKSIFFSFLFIPLSVAMFPHVFQHWLTARSAQAFKLPIVMHPVFIIIVWVPCVLIGIWASAPMSGLPDGINENQVLATMVKLHAGDLLGGLLTAGILAAIMSSLDSQFLCLGTIFTEDVVLHYAKKGSFSDGHVVLMARLFIVVIVVLTYLLSRVFPRSVFDLGVWSFSGFAGLFPLVLAAIYWRRLTAVGAMAGIVTAVASWAILFWRADLGADQRYGFPETPISIAGEVVIPTMLPVVTILFLSLVATVSVSLVTRPPNDKTLAKFFSGKPSTRNSN